MNTAISRLLFTEYWHLTLDLVAAQEEMDRSRVELCRFAGENGLRFQSGFGVIVTNREVAWQRSWTRRATSVAVESSVSLSREPADKLRWAS